MLEVLQEQGALILNPYHCPICQEAGYEINYRFPKWLPAAPDIEQAAGEALS